MKGRNNNFRPNGDNKSKKASNMSFTKSRKNKRKEMRKQKKIIKNRCLYEKSSVNNSNSNENSSNRLKALQKLVEQEKAKILQNKKGHNSDKNNKNTKKKQDKLNNNEKQECSSFKTVQSASMQERMAKLQAFVNKESQKSSSEPSKKESKSKKRKLDATEEIEDEKQKELKILLKEDHKEINRYAKLLGIRKAEKKKKVHSMFDDFDMNFLLQDVDQQSMEHQQFYQDSNSISNTLEDDIKTVSLKQRQKQSKYLGKRKELSLDDPELDNDVSSDDSEMEFDMENEFQDQNESNDDELPDDYESINEFPDDSESFDEILDNESSGENELDSEKEINSSNKRVKFNDNPDIRIIKKKIKCKKTNNEIKTKSILKQPSYNGNEIDSEQEDMSDDYNGEYDDSDIDNESSDSEENFDADTESDMENDNEKSKKKDEKIKLQKDNTEIKEDIYGRTVDAKGNVIKAEEASNTGRYIPPALRNLMKLDSTDEKKKEKLRNLNRTLKGLLNRLALENMAGICSQIEQFYVKNSRNDVNDTLVELLINSVVMNTITPERLVQEYALMIGVLSINIGIEVGAHILTKFVEMWDEKFSKAPSLEQENKELDNILLFICHLYNFKVVGAKLLYDILAKHIEAFREKDIDMIIHILRSVGFTLRKDDPLELKSIISNVQNQASSKSPEDESYTRITFMTEILLAIRNNNMAKMPDYDPTHVEHLKKVLKGLGQKGKQSPELKVSLKDLLDSKETGRWWLVGSAWAGGLIENQKPVIDDEPERKIKKKAPVVYSEKFKKYAAKLHLSRAPRINILYAMTEGSHDVHDAFEKLLQLSLPHTQEKEMFEVMILLCIKGKVYNPFYAHLSEKFCSFAPKYKRLLLHTLWDKLSQISELKSNGIANLSQFVSFLISEECINLSVFKTLSFLESGELVISFVRQVLLSILLHPAGESVVRTIFNQLSASPKLKLLRQTLRIFILKFIKPENPTSENFTLLINRVKVATSCLECQVTEL